MKPRLTPIVPGTRPEQADLERRIERVRGRISPLYQVLLHSPALASGWEQMLTAIRNRSSVDASLRELAILRVAVLNRAPYEFEAHVSHALQAGLHEDQIAALRSVRPDETRFTARERDVLALTDAMTCDVDVPDEVHARVAAHFDEQGLLEIVATVAAYNMVSRLLVALRIH